MESMRICVDILLDDDGVARSEDKRFTFSRAYTDMLTDVRATTMSVTIDLVLDLQIDDKSDHTPRHNELRWTIEAVDLDCDGTLRQDTYHYHYPSPTQPVVAELLPLIEYQVEVSQ